MDEIRYLVSSGGTVSLYHASMAPPTEQCTHRTMLLPVYRGAHVHGIGLPNTREWVSTRLACGISGCSTRHLTRSTSGMTMPWSALLDIPLAGYVLLCTTGCGPCAWCVLACCVSYSYCGIPHSKSECSQCYATWTMSSRTRPRWSASMLDIIT